MASSYRQVAVAERRPCGHVGCDRPCQGQHFQRRLIRHWSIAAVVVVLMIFFHLTLDYHSSWDSDHHRLRPLQYRPQSAAVVVVAVAGNADVSVRDDVGQPLLKNVDDVAERPNLKVKK